jgi:hypothetical protein
MLCADWLGGRSPALTGSKTALWEVPTEVLAAVVVESTVFWNIMPYNTLEVNRRFRGTYHLLLQGQIVIQARNQCESKRQNTDSALILSVDIRWTTRRYIVLFSMKLIMICASFGKLIIYSSDCQLFFFPVPLD